MKKILVAEDEEVLLNVLKDRFEVEGWEVTTAKDGVEAMEAINKSKFDLVLLDLLMPKKDGFEVLEEVKNNPELKNIPIIVLSNLGGDDDIKKALALGAKDYFVKTQHPMSEIVEKAKKYVIGGDLTSSIIKQTFTPIMKDGDSSVSPELNNYVKNSRATGMKDEEIKTNLKNNGWVDKDIDAALSN